MTAENVERWGRFEVSLEGPQDGNPFVDVEFGAILSYKHRTIDVDGFYDGDGVYRVRFMPDVEGTWCYRTRSNMAELNGVGGEFDCVAPSAGNHGPVRVRDTYHFAYEDGTPYWQFGTTCYVWNHQGDELEEQTLRTLAGAPFNKMRMCVFPKHYTFNQNEPPYHPFAGSLEQGWDFRCFNPAFFRHLEQRIAGLGELGIEADLILFHPYDRWGYATMDAESDDFYLRYVVARLSAFRNVWWSMANEYDLMKAKTMQDWDRFFRIVQESDPVQHLRSVHNCRAFYDHNKPWVTHQSIQRHDLTQVSEWREQCKKPVVVDECRYEGNIPNNWGNITARQMAHNFWEGMVRGGYVGHGETYVHPDDILWWSKGGVLHGESPARIAFLRGIVEQSGLDALSPVFSSSNLVGAGQEGEYVLVYFGMAQPKYKVIPLPEDAQFEIEVIDTWEMTITPLSGTFSGNCQIDLPGKPQIALRIRRV
ncbi:MAG: DUF5060 domain-containing protein [Anaerolineae bacterium]|nr:DUF5060 domain-containing protein [Anaerolineae bacterium]